MSKLLKLMHETNSENLEEWHKYNKIYLEEKSEMTKRKFRKILEQEFQLETLGKFQTGLKKIIKDNNLKLKEQVAIENNNGYIWIIVNPKLKIEFEYFRKKIEKLVDRKLFVDVCYVFEQRGTNIEESGKGFHAHILAKRNLNYKPTKCKACIQNTCKDLVGNLKNNN